METRERIIANIIEAGGTADSRDFDLEAIADEVLEPAYPWLQRNDVDPDMFWQIVQNYAHTYEVELEYADTAERDRVIRYAVTKNNCRMLASGRVDWTFTDSDYDAILVDIFDRTGIALGNLYESATWNEATKTEVFQVAINWNESTNHVI